MAINCPGCGSENADGARFCRACGATIAQASAATVMQPSPQPPAPDPSMAPTTGMPAITPPQAPAYAPPPPPYTPPAQPYAPPAYQQPAYQQPYAPAYQQPAYPSTYPAAARASSRRGGAFYVGAAIVLLCGLLILVSTFMAWFTVGDGPYKQSMSGWDTRDFIENGFFDWGDGKPLFSGYSSLIAGTVILFLGIILLASRSKGLAGLVLVLAVITLIIAAVNTYSILTVGDGLIEYSLGAGMFLFLAGSTGGVIGSIVCMAG